MGAICSNEQGDMPNIEKLGKSSNANELLEKKKGVSFATSMTGVPSPKSKPKTAEMATSITGLVFEDEQKTKLVESATSTTAYPDLGPIEEIKVPPVPGMMPDKSVSDFINKNFSPQKSVTGLEDMRKYFPWSF